MSEFDLYNKYTNNPMLQSNFQRGSTYAAIGDSIIIGDSVQSGLYPRTNNCWFIQSLWKNKAKFIVNAGISGNTTTQMLARIDADVIAHKPSVCFIAGGTNDIGASQSTVSIQGIISNIEQMITKLLYAKVTPILCSLTPRATITTAITKTNLLLFELANKYKIQYIDFYPTMVDVANGQMLSSYTTDGLHPIYTGKEIMANAVTAQYFDRIPKLNQPLIESLADTDNMIPNGLFTIDTNADGTPDSWTGTGSGTTRSIVTGDSSIKGNWFKMTRSNATQHDCYSSAITTGYSVGDKLNFSGIFKTASLQADVTTVNIHLLFGTVNIYAGVAYYWKNNGTYYFNIDVTVPEGATNIRVACDSFFGTGEISLAQLTLKNLTTIGLV